MSKYTLSNGEKLDIWVLQMKARMEYSLTYFPRCFFQDTSICVTVTHICMSVTVAMVINTELG